MKTDTAHQDKHTHTIMKQLKQANIDTQKQTHKKTQTNAQKHKQIMNHN